MKTEILELEITQEDIDLAVKINKPRITNCPIAQCVKRNGISFSSVSDTGDIYNEEGRWNGGEDAFSFVETSDKFLNGFSKTKPTPTKLVFTRKVA